MNVKKLREEFVGKELKTIIDVNTSDSEITAVLKKVTKNSYEEVQTAKILLFEDNKALIFVDFDSDGYRSGNWELVHIKEILDRGQTEGIKVVNSVVQNIEYFEDAKIPNNYSDSNCVLITTEEYVISMGQDHSDSYYPSNFFDLKECKESALGFKIEDSELINLDVEQKDGE